MSFRNTFSFGVGLNDASTHSLAVRKFHTAITMQIFTRESTTVVEHRSEGVSRLSLRSSKWQSCVIQLYPTINKSTVPRRKMAQSLEYTDELELRRRCKSIGLTSQRLGYRMYGSGFNKCRSLDLGNGLDSTSSARYLIPDSAEAKATLSLR